MGLSKDEAATVCDSPGPVAGAPGQALAVALMVALADAEPRHRNSSTGAASAPRRALFDRAILRESLCIDADAVG